MNPTRTCPKCAAPLPPDAPHGHCPQCLLALALEAKPGEATQAALEQATLDSGSAASRGDQPALQFKAGEQVRYFGDYELLEEIARGGMGVVWKARQVSLNRPVAVKMILGGQLANEAEVKRFHIEAEAAANLKHPNIVAIHEIGEHEGRHYFSMDLIAGRNLAQVAGNVPMPVQRAAELLKTLADAVHYAHQRGTLHRDLKPQNVLLDAEGQPHITDFGLAKQLTAASDLTQSGAVMGSPSYMPPEQALGRQADIGPASDVYSLGAILYQLLTGRAPFVGATAMDTLRLVIEQEVVPPTRLNPSVPSDLETLCLKCLEKKPERRYASARALAEELERFLNHEPILAKPASVTRKAWNWSQKNPWVFAAGFGALVLVLACVAYGLWEMFRLATWRLEAGKTAPLPHGDSPAPMFFAYFLGMSFLLYFAGNAFRRHYRQVLAQGALLAERQLLFHGALGMAGAVLGLGHLINQIRSWVWLPSHPLMLALELAAFVCALFLAGMGARNLWEAVGIHDSSRFRQSVSTALAAQVDADTRRWSLLRLIGLVIFLLVSGVAGILLFATALEKNPLTVWGTVLGIIPSLLTASFGWRAIRNRLRLLGHFFAPLAVLGFVILVSILLQGKPTAAFGISCLVTYVLGLFGAVVLIPKAAADSTKASRFPGNPWLDALSGVAVFIALLASFHLVENWRGKRAWQQVKADLEAKGESLDLNTFLKPPVLDDQNVMAHPYMKRHFIKGTTSWPVFPPASKVGHLEAV